MWPLLSSLSRSSPATQANFLPLNSPLLERTAPVCRGMITGILVCREKSNFIWERLANQQLLLFLQAAAGADAG